MKSCRARVWPLIGNMGLERLGPPHPLHRSFALRMPPVTAAAPAPCSISGGAGRGESGATAAQLTEQRVRIRVVEARQVLQQKPKPVPTLWSLRSWAPWVPWMPWDVQERVQGRGCCALCASVQTGRRDVRRGQTMRARAAAILRGVRRTLFLRAPFGRNSSWQPRFSQSQPRALVHCSFARTVLSASASVECIPEIGLVLLLHRLQHSAAAFSSQLRQLQATLLLLRQSATRHRGSEQDLVSFECSTRKTAFECSTRSWWICGSPCPAECCSVPGSEQCDGARPAEDGWMVGDVPPLHARPSSTANKVPASRQASSAPGCRRRVIIA